MTTNSKSNPLVARLGSLALIGALAVTASACRQDMHDQPRIEPLEASTFFADGMASRLPVEGTIAQGQLRDDVALYEGKDSEGALLAKLPMTVNQPLLERGQQRYDIFCAPCHGRLGDGQGMVVQRGYKKPPSMHTDPLKSQPDGYYYDVMTNGFGVMQSYASQIPVEDRWAIAAYIRALQLSQGVDVALLPSADREALENPGSAAGSATGERSGGH